MKDEALRLCIEAIERLQGHLGAFLTDEDMIRLYTHAEKAKRASQVALADPGSGGPGDGAKPPLGAAD